jgi:hypothetical protein
MALREAVRSRAVDKRIGEDRSSAYTFTKTVDKVARDEDGGLAVIDRDLVRRLRRIWGGFRNHPHKPVITNLVRTSTESSRSSLYTQLET